MQISDPDDPAIKAEIRIVDPVHSGCTNFSVQPGCTNLGLSTLLSSQGPLPAMTAALFATRPGKDRIQIEYGRRLRTCR
jgi:hypothetical protein